MNNQVTLNSKTSLTETPEEEGGSGDGEGEQGSAGQPPEEEEERLPIDGQPLEIENQPEEEEETVVQSAEELSVEPGEEQTLEAPFTRQPLNATGDDLGPGSLNLSLGKARYYSAAILHRRLVLNVVTME